MRDRLTRNSHSSRHFRLWHSGGEQLRCARPVARHGDPRDHTVDAIDWGERIPFSETRNYVQRVMENLLVYRARFETGAPAIAKFDQPHGTAQEVSSALPRSSTQPSE